MTAGLIPLTRELFETFHGKPPTFRLKGVAVVKNGQPLAVGGIGLHGTHLSVFMDMLPEAARYPKLLLAGGRRVVELARDHRVPAYAVQNEALETAPRFLARLGFWPEGDLWRLQ